MTHEAARPARRCTVLAGACALLLPAALEAQGGGDGFLFKRPSVSITIRTGYDVRRAESDLLNFVQDTFRVARHDFDAPAFGGEIAVRATDRLDVVLGLAYARSEVRSEYEHWVDQDELPIEQETEFRTTPLTLSARYYLADRGRSIGRFAWVPSRLAPYVGGGLGIVWYRFAQDGDFVNLETLEIYPDRLLEEGASLGVHALAGLDLSLNQFLVLNTEARLVAGSGDVDGFSYGRIADELDLSGLQLTVGLGVRF